MTMVIVGLLHGKTKEEWYNQIADRVAKGDGPCAPPEYGKSDDGAHALEKFLLTQRTQPNYVALESVNISGYHRKIMNMMLTEHVALASALAESSFSETVPK